ncbi:type IV pilus assembly protein FimV [Massilia horti]|uniref:FimV N-terminal domain-containing protein n=1 Tax=Massilia horti TaxID=2562153 RepID=A0A4Y9SY88_9BURK|nr:hypothetical protein [Massilia horti]TFW29593.1 hypothetical protein E4O92_18815 [Massilia horti]
MAHRLSQFLTGSLLAVLALTHVRAAELAEARVSSHIGQQLVADIELVGIDNPAEKVAVRLAHPDVYRGANLLIPEVLSNVSLSVMQRDGRQFLHVTSLMPVDADHLHLYLELDDGGHKVVRLSTLWLTPNPAPVSRPPPEPAAPALPAFKPVAPRAQVVPPAAPPRPIRMPAPVPVTEPASKPPAPAACAPVAPLNEEKACIALGAKNAALREKIGQLEHKVTVLGTLARAPQAPPPGAIKPKPAPKKQAEADKGGWRWVVAGIVGAVLAALAGGGLFVYRRNKAIKAKETALRGGIKSRLMPGP